MNIEQELQTTLEESTRYHTLEKLSEILDSNIIEQGFQQAGIALFVNEDYPRSCFMVCYWYGIVSKRIRLEHRK